MFILLMIYRKRRYAVKKLLLIISALALMFSLSANAEDEDFEGVNFDKVLYVSENGKYNGRGRTPDDAFLMIDSAFDEIEKHSGTYEIVIDGEVDINGICGMKMSRTKVCITGKGSIDVSKGVSDPEHKSSYSPNEKKEPAATFYIPSDCEMVFGGRDCEITGGVSVRNKGICTVNDGVGVTYISNSGTLTLNGGSAVLEKSVSMDNLLNNMGTVNINGFKYSGTDPDSSVIYNSPLGVINMNDGEISGCRMGVENHGEFNLNGGRIFDCSTYAVRNYKTFNRAENTICNGKVYDFDEKGNSVLRSDENTPLETPESTAPPIPEQTPDPSSEPTAAPVETAAPTLEPPEAGEEIPVYINRIKIHVTDSRPFIDENDRTQAPVRAIGEALGCEVGYDNVNGEEVITMIKGEKTVIMKIGSSDINVNGNVIKMDTSARLVEDRTYIPARYIGESLGYNVSWIDGCVMIDN